MCILSVYSCLRVPPVEFRLNILEVVLQKPSLLVTTAKFPTTGTHHRSYLKSSSYYPFLRFLFISKPLSQPQSLFSSISQDICPVLKSSMSNSRTFC